MQIKHKLQRLSTAPSLRTKIEEGEISRFDVLVLMAIKPTEAQAKDSKSNGGVVKTENEIASMAEQILILPIVLQNEKGRLYYYR